MVLENCWEIKGGGRELGGFQEMDQGPCPASPRHGHSCWLVCGTLCDGKVQGTFARKEENCLRCEVYQRYNLRNGSHREGVIRQHPDEICESAGLPATSIDPSGDAGENLREASRALENSLEDRLQERAREVLEDARRMREANELLRREVAERKAAQDRLRRLAFHDALTGLPNRAFLSERLDQEITHADRQGETLGVIVLDLDRLHTINTSLGHFMGDRVLRACAERLVESVRRYDVVGRLAGDEFAILAPHVTGPRRLRRLALRILRNLREPLQLGVRRLYLTASAGIASYPGDGTSAKTLLKNAGAAMQRAKESGGNTVCLYEREANDRSIEMVRLESDLQEGLRRGAFEVEYQPQVDLGSGRVSGFEALVRWNHPRRGILSPDSFLPVAEETGLILPLGEWVLEAACRQARAWRDEGLPRVRLAVNVSARQIRQKTLDTIVHRVLEETGLEPRDLDLEITETAILRETACAVATLTELHDWGVHLSLDDFGTGYSSLNHLRELPVDAVKLDRSFVAPLPASSRDLTIVKALVTMAHGLDLHVLAEGVETGAQLEALRAMGCDAAQGFLLGPPLPAGRVAELLRGGRIAPTPA